MQTRPRPKKYRPKNKKRKIHKPGPPGYQLEAYQVLLQPLVTEKGTHQSTRHNAYTFQVNKGASKNDIRSAVEEMFNVRVTQVRTMLCHGKKRRHRQREGQMPDWKKAVVTLHSEDKIEFF
jgi:large subunit ribosomal protein L23